MSIGGVEKKIEAAISAGFKEVIVPYGNKEECIEYENSIKIHYVKKIEKAYNILFNKSNMSTVQSQQTDTLLAPPAAAADPSKRKSRASSLAAAMSSRKMSLFNRWKNQSLWDSALEGISEEEMVEYRQGEQRGKLICGKKDWKI